MTRGGAKAPAPCSLSMDRRSRSADALVRAFQHPGFARTKSSALLPLAGSWPVSRSKRCRELSRDSNRLASGPTAGSQFNSDDGANNGKAGPRQDGSAARGLNGGCPPRFYFVAAGLLSLASFLIGQSGESVRASLSNSSNFATTSEFSSATFFFSPGSDFKL